VRRKISDLTIFDAPLILVNEGFMNIAFSDFSVVYKHGVRGIHGSPQDRSILMFLTAYLRSQLGKYFLFHTSSSWGVSRRRVDVEDLMLLPWFSPEQADDPLAAWALVKECVNLITKTRVASDAASDLNNIVDAYFGVSESEKTLVDDTMKIIEPSTRPGRKRTTISTIMPVDSKRHNHYLETLCATLNGWADKGYTVHGWADIVGSVAVAVLMKTKENLREHRNPLLWHRDLEEIFDLIQTLGQEPGGALRWIRGVKVFDNDCLYIVKPKQRRFWTRSAALNDADEIADAILAQRPS
jgi:hypothetical protein